MNKRFTQPDRWVWGDMTNADGARLRYGTLERHAAPAANLVIAAGLSEFAEKYFETARIFSRMGYNVYTMDWRGQGGSERYLRDRFKRHSLGFDRDSRDLTQFVTTIVPGNAPKVLLSHSMGALPALLALRDHPKLFRAAAMAAPLLGFERRPAKGLEPLLAMLPLKSRWAERYIPNGGPWQPRRAPGKINPPQDFSSDPVRMHLHDEWMAGNPALQVGDPTYGWVLHAARAMMALRRRGALEAIKTPILIFTAGQEKIISNKAVFEAAARLPAACRRHIPAAGHEIWMERADLRRPALRESLNFFRANL